LDAFSQINLNMCRRCSVPTQQARFYQHFSCQMPS